MALLAPYGVQGFEAVKVHLRRTKRAHITTPPEKDASMTLFGGSA
jgi:hypothetical protein